MAQSGYAPTPCLAGTRLSFPTRERFFASIRVPRFYLLPCGARNRVKRPLRRNLSAPGRFRGASQVPSRFFHFVCNLHRTVHLSRSSVSPSSPERLRNAEARPGPDYLESSKDRNLKARILRARDARETSCCQGKRDTGLLRCGLARRDRTTTSCYDVLRATRRRRRHFS